MALACSLIRDLFLKFILVFDFSQKEKALSKCNWEKPKGIRQKLKKDEKKEQETGDQSSKDLIVLI